MYNICKFNYRFDFITLCSFRRNQKQESIFQQTGALLTKNISVLFKVSRTLLQRQPELIDFIKGILLYVISLLFILYFCYMLFVICYMLFICYFFVIICYMLFLYVMLCAIWYHLYNLKNKKNTHGGVLLLVKLQALISVGVFHVFF